MTTRPFGSVAWGLGIALAVGLIFAISTSVFLAVSGSPVRDVPGANQRLGRIAIALGDIAPPALALGRFVATGQSEDMRAYLTSVASLQTELRAVSTGFAGNPSAIDQISQLDQQLVRAIAAGRQVLSQPGSGLLNAGGAGSVEQVATAALSSVKAGLEDLLKTELDRSPVVAAPTPPSEKPEFRVWLGGWSALGAVLAVLLLVTALRPERDGAAHEATVSHQNVQRSHSGTSPRSPAPPDGGMLANVARQLELAHLDGLTGLLNQQALAPTVEKAIERSLRKGVTIGMIYLEVEGFKALREQLGSAISNAVIIEVGKQLKETFRRGDQVARLRDGEFAVVVAEISTRDILARLEERVHEAIADIRIPALHGARVKAHIGLAMYPIDGYSDRDLLETARNAVLYRATDGMAQKAIAAPPPEAPAVVAAPVPVEQPAEPAPETIETHVDASLAELHALIGKYLQAEHGSADKQSQAQVLIGEFKRRT